MSNFDKLQGREGSQNAVWYGGRYLDPIRNAALHEAVKAVAPWPEDRLMVDSILVVAEAFKRWLEGTDKAMP